MNNKTAIGLLVALIVIGIAAFFFQKKVPETVTIPLGDTPAETGTTTQTIPGVPNIPGAKVEQLGEKQIKTPRITSIDSASLKTGSSKPVITGTANIGLVAIVVEDSSGVGVTGSYEIPVTDGRWSFPVPMRLKPGMHVVYLIGGDDVLVSSMNVK